MSVTPTNSKRRYRLAIHGSPTSYYRRRRDRRHQDRQEALQGRGDRVPTLKAIANPESLIGLYSDLRRHGGPAPGIDGIHYDDLGRSEVAAACRQVSKAIMAGTYRPYPAREVKIAKRSGTGHRTLRLRNILDRLVATAIDRELSPHWDRVFLPQSFGFRPRRSVADMLAYLEHEMVSQNCWVMTTDDVRDAFDHVSIADLVQDHRRQNLDTGILWLVERVLRGGEGIARTKGIDQGGAYSPTAMNICLHYAHDLGVTLDRTIPAWARYADNLVYLTQDVSAGHQARITATNLLSDQGMTLKGLDGPPTDLREGGTRLLGFELAARPDGSGLRISIGNNAWENLSQNLVETHTMANPPEMARNAVLGWASTYGMACEETMVSDTVDRVLSIASVAGYQEISPLDLVKTLEDAQGRWQASRRGAVHSHVHGVGE